MRQPDIVRRMTNLCESLPYQLQLYVVDTLDQGHNMVVLHALNRCQKIVSRSLA